MKTIQYLMIFLVIFGVTCKSADKGASQLKGVITQGNERVKIFRVVDGNKQEVSSFDTLKTNDDIKLIPGSNASLDFQGQLQLELNRNAELKLEKLQPNAIELKLDNGNMRLTLPPPKDTIRVDVYTPTVITSIRGTELNFEIDNQGRTIVWMKSGTADITHRQKKDQTLTLQPNQMIIADAEKISTPKLFNETDSKLLNFANMLSGMIWLEPDFAQWDNQKLTFSIVGKLFEDDIPNQITPSMVANFKRLAVSLVSENNYTYRIMGYDKANGEEQARQVYLKLIEVGIPAEKLSWGMGTLPAKSAIQIEVEFIP